MKEYPVFLKEECVGNATVQQEGLFSRIICRCRIYADGFARLYVSDGNNIRDLGIMIPDADTFVVDTRISTMGMNEEKLSFWISNGKREELFIPIEPIEEFACLDKLRKARFENKNGVCGIVIPADP